jgi:hypothetical protein
MGERREGVTTFFFTVGLSVYMAAGCQLLAASCCTVMIDVWGSGVWGRWIYCVPALVRPPFSAFPLIGHILAHHSRLCRHHHGGFHPTILAWLHPLLLT